MQLNRNPFCVLLCLEICEPLNGSPPSLIRTLRFDSLAQMMMYGNVHAGSNILLVESHGGLVAQAILERLGSRDFGGRLFNFYHGTSPPIIQVRPVEYYSKASFF